MFQQLSAKRLLPKTPLLATARRVMVARHLVSSSYSRRDEVNSRRDEVISNWEALRANPSEWFDNRTRKTNPKAPDFVKRDDRAVAIWIDGRDTPDWHEDVLAELDARRMGGGRRESAAGDRAGGEGNDRRAVELSNWESLRKNPEEWFDNRSRKTNPRAPDFRRRDDRNVALWLDSYGAPEWVGELLQELDERQAQRRAGFQREQQDGLQAPQQHIDDKRAAEMSNWNLLRSNPELWFDNRHTKSNPKAPDFKLKSDRSVALWLSSYQVPDFINELIAELDARHEQRVSAQQQQGYQPYPEQPQGYVDSPQAQQQQYQQSMGLADEEQAKWDSLRNNPDQWFDNRYSKPTPKSPDFRRKDDRTVALWLNSRAVPDWIDELLPQLDARYQQREASRAAMNTGPDGVY